MLSFCLESVAFQFAIQKYKNYVVQNNNFAYFLYGCETLPLTLREECRLRVLRRIFGSKRDEVRGEWKRLHNEKLYDLYFSQNIFW